MLLFAFPGPTGASGPHQTAIEAPVASAGVSDDGKAAAKPTPESGSAPRSIDRVPASSTSSTTSINSATSTPRAGTQPEPLTASAPSSALNLYLPPPPTFVPQGEPIRRPSRAWFALMAAEHSAAGFDAWSTRQAVGQGRVEADPLMRPFSHSGAIYGAIQVVPLGLDYVARRMQRSSGWTRHVWWVPQSFATASFIFSGTYNFSHLH